MKTGPLLALTCALVISASACAPRTFHPERAIDPTPLLAALADRRETLGTGLSGTIELEYKGEDGRFRGRAHVTILPDGPFRIEIPGFMGSTLLAMASDGEEVLAYYPEEGRAYRGPAAGSSLGALLPFPLPLDAVSLPSILLGILSGPSDPDGARAGLLASGERTLQVPGDGAGPSFGFLFARRDPPALRAFHCSRGDLRLDATTGGAAPNLPETFTATFPDARLEGRWEGARIFNGNAADLQVRVPLSVPVTDLGKQP